MISIDIDILISKRICIIKDEACSINYIEYVYNIKRTLEVQKSRDPIMTRKLREGHTEGLGIHLDIKIFKISTFWVQHECTQWFCVFHAQLGTGRNVDQMNPFAPNTLKSSSRRGRCIE